MTERLLSPDGLAEMLDVPKKTIYEWHSRADADGPPAHKIGRHLRYRLADVEAWLATRRDADRPVIRPPGMGGPPADQPRTPPTDPTHKNRDGPSHPPRWRRRP